MMDSTEMVCLPPPPCQPPPSVVGPGQACYCNLTTSLSPGICQEGQLCHTTCITPVYCADPTTQQDWNSRNARLRSGLTDTFIQWSTLEVECLEETSTPEGEVRFTAMCGEKEGGGAWNMSSCSFRACTEVEVDTESVEVREDTTQGAILKFSCKDEAEVFTVGSGLTRIQAVCNRR